MSVNSKLTRRRFIKGVIFSGAAASTGAGYYLATAQSGGGAAERLVNLNIMGVRDLLMSCLLRHLPTPCATSLI